MVLKVEIAIETIEMLISQGGRTGGYFKQRTDDSLVLNTNAKQSAVIDSYPAWFGR